MYIPMLKARQTELNVVKKVCDLFSDEIIPLIEILNETDYKTDTETGEFIRQKVNGRNVKIKIQSNENSTMTLENINSKIKSKKILIDYFRFRETKYGKGLNFNSLQLAWQLSNNENMYLKYIEKVCKFKNMIPVISIKNGFEINASKLMSFIKKLHTETNSVALRITEEFLSEYVEVIENCMNENDYLLFDIQEQNPDSKIMELIEVSLLNCDSKKILLNSPRNAKYRNSEFNENGICDLIFTSAKTLSEDNALDGFGDYCGMRDSLPTSGGSGKGAALALFFDFKINKFYSYVEKNKDLGAGGYKNIIPIILNDSSKLDPDKDCQAMAEVYALYQRNCPGNWTTWHKINMIRSIQQIFKYYNQ
ncbi:MAG: hypothetical protein RR945_02630 [Erysipelotrichaceae bacterium]